MNGTLISLLVFAALVGSGLGGAALSAFARRALTSAEARDFVRRTLSFVAVLAAIMLGTSTASLKVTFDGAERDVHRLASQIEELDRTLRRIGPAAAPARDLLFRYAVVLTRDIWPRLDGTLHGEPRGVGTLQDEFELSLERLAASLPGSRLVLQSQVLLHDIAQTRWTMEERTGSSISGRQVGLLVFWLMLIFAGLGLFAPRNALVLGMLLLCAAGLAGAIFLLTEFDDPFRGAITVSGEPMLATLHALADN